MINNVSGCVRCAQPDRAQGEGHCDALEAPKYKRQTERIMIINRPSRSLKGPTKACPANRDH